MTTTDQHSEKRLDNMSYQLLGRVCGAYLWPLSDTRFRLLAFFHALYFRCFANLGVRARRTIILPKCRGLTTFVKADKRCTQDLGEETICSAYEVAPMKRPRGADAMPKNQTFFCSVCLGSFEVFNDCAWITAVAHIAVMP